MLPCDFIFMVIKHFPPPLMITVMAFYFQAFIFE